MPRKILFSICFVFGFNITEQGPRALFITAQSQKGLARICAFEFLRTLNLPHLPITGFGRVLIPKSSRLAPLHITICVLADVGLVTLFSTIITPSLSSAALALFLVTGISFGVEAITKTIECRSNGFEMPLRLDRMLLRQIPSGIGAAVCVLRIIPFVGTPVNIPSTIFITIFVLWCNAYPYLANNLFLEKAFFVEFFATLIYPLLPFIYINPMLKVCIILVCSIIRCTLIYYTISNDRRPNGAILDSTGSMLLVSAVNSFMQKMNKLPRYHDDLSRWGDDIFNVEGNMRQRKYINLLFAIFNQPEAFNVLRELNSALQPCFDEIVEAAEHDPRAEKAKEISDKIRLATNRTREKLGPLKNKILDQMLAESTYILSRRDAQNIQRRTFAIFAMSNDLAFLESLVRFLVVTSQNEPQIHYEGANITVVFNFLSYFRQ